VYHKKVESESIDKKKKRWQEKKKKNPDCSKKNKYAMQANDMMDKKRECSFLQSVRGMKKKSNI